MGRRANQRHSRRGRARRLLHLRRRRSGPRPAANGTAWTRDRPAPATRSASRPSRPPRPDRLGAGIWPQAAALLGLGTGGTCSQLGGLAPPPPRRLNQRPSVVSPVPSQSLVLGGPGAASAKGTGCRCPGCPPADRQVDALELLLAHIVRLVLAPQPGRLAVELGHQPRFCVEKVGNAEEALLPVEDRHIDLRSRQAGLPLDRTFAAGSPTGWHCEAWATRTPPH